MPRAAAPSASLAVVAFCLALSGCWVRVRTTSHLPAAAPVGGGEIHAVYVAGGAPGAIGTASASASTSASVDVSASLGWSARTTGGLEGATSGGGAVAGAATGSGGGVASGATTGVAGEPGVGITSADTGLAWSADGGWAPASPPIAGAYVPGEGAAVIGESSRGASAHGDLSIFTVPRLGGTSTVTGAGVRLSALATVGVTIDDCACSLDGEVAALARLRPLEASFEAGTLDLGDGRVSIDVGSAHAALGPSGGASAIVVRAVGGEAPAVPPPIRVHLVIDASTSMRSRWPEVKDAALSLVGQLHPADELQIVVYGDGATVALPVAPVGDGAAARAVIRGLHCGGRTHIESGLRAAYDAAASGSIVLLLSDGVPMGGAATPDELGAIAGEARRTSGVTTFAIGLGSEFHPGILHALATEGGGDFRIAPRTADVELLFRAALEAHGRVVARDVSIDLALGAGVTLRADAVLPPGVEVVSGRVHIGVPQLSAGTAVEIALPVEVAGGTTVVATADASWSAAGAVASGHGTLRIAAGTEAVPAGGMAIALDADLRSELAIAASAVENGDGVTARAALDAHAQRVEAVLATFESAALHERATAARALGFELEALVSAASFAERRQTASTMLEWSLGLGR